MWKSRRLNNSQRSICDACHSASSRSHHSPLSEFCAAAAELLMAGGGVTENRDRLGPDQGVAAPRRRSPTLKLTDGFSGTAAGNFSLLHDTHLLLVSFFKLTNVFLMFYPLTSIHFCIKLLFRTQRRSSLRAVQQQICFIVVNTIMKLG